MNRRSFFARTAGAFVAAVALSLKAPERVIEYRVNTTGIDEATYVWWRTRIVNADISREQLDAQFRDAFNRCYR